MSFSRAIFLFPLIIVITDCGVISRDSYAFGKGVDHLAISNNLGYLRKFSGKLMHDTDLFTKASFRNRLKKILKAKIKFVESNTNVDTPIEINNNVFIAWGCKQHYCDSNNFIIVVDFKKNVVYCGIRENNVVKIYSEDGSNNLEISKWANRN